MSNVDIYDEEKNVVARFAGIAYRKKDNLEI